MSRLIAACLIALLGLASAQTPGTDDARGRQDPDVILGVSGDYLGQEPPGATPRLFAPGIVSTGMLDRDIAVLPGGGEIYFGRAGAGYAYSAILVTRRLLDGRWTRPEVASFVAPYPAHDLEVPSRPTGSGCTFCPTARPKAMRARTVTATSGPSTASSRAGASPSTWASRSARRTRSTFPRPRATGRSTSPVRRRASAVTSSIARGWSTAGTPSPRSCRAR